jgi:DNA-binding LytR/AlgR family response regulator
MIKAVAIDDEPPALKVIEAFCGECDFIKLEKTFTRPHEALDYLEKFPVDLLFLDIQMPSMTGVELYKAIKQKTMVIFTTAYSEYAIEGFNLNAVDYLLKPFTLERFMQAVNKVADSRALQNQKEKTGQYLFIRADYSLVKILISDILFIEGLDDYLKIHIQDQKTIVTRMTLKAMLDKLPSGEFFRVHRSYIVPLSRIDHIRNKVISIGSERIPVGNSYEEAFFKAFTGKTG